MPKLNFNVPLEQIDGKLFLQGKVDEDTNEVVMGKDGKPVAEEVPVRMIIASFLQRKFEADDTEEFEVLARRGKLARKIIGSEEVNYTDKEQTMIMELAARSNQPTMVIAHIDRIINPEDVSPAAVSKVKK